MADGIRSYRGARAASQQMIRAFFVIVLTFAFICIVGTPYLIYTLLSGNTDRIYNIGLHGCRMALWLAGVRLEIYGKEKIPADRAVVFMPNHQSNCDPPAVFTVLPPVLILAKKGFFRVPVLGRGMVLRGFVPVDRKNRDQAIGAVEKAVTALKAGHSFLAYPEGTRSRDGRLQPFKKGVFVMAIKAQVPIVPISVSGGSRVMRKGEFAIHPGPVRLTIHDAVPTAGFTLAERDKVIEIVRRKIVSGLAADELPVDTVEGLNPESSLPRGATSA